MAAARGLDADLTKDTQINAKRQPSGCATLGSGSDKGGSRLQELVEVTVDLSARRGGAASEELARAMVVDQVEVDVAQRAQQCLPEVEYWSSSPRPSTTARHALHTPRDVARLRARRRPRMSASGQARRRTAPASLSPHRCHPRHAPLMQP
jgi:hypothetical protein|uniref:Uncharacterized protein n=1 Tax=Oryza sativa subsp. japonica TaxID=39947 RepID=Q8H8W3_ORYSJ|nr:hypothetical protein [Oryza sativa Japonica Group]